MTAPDASARSRNECNNEPSVNGDHEDAEHSQECALYTVRLGLAKQTKRAHANCNTEAAD